MWCRGEFQRTNGKHKKLDDPKQSMEMMKAITIKIDDIETLKWMNWLIHTEYRTRQAHFSTQESRVDRKFQSSFCEVCMHANHAEPEINNSSPNSGADFLEKTGAGTTINPKTGEALLESSERKIGCLG